MKLGNPNGAAAIRRAEKGNSAACQKQREHADERAKDLKEVIDDLNSSGFLTLSAQAFELNKRGIKTARGGVWHASTVANLKARLANLA
ncbi:hypothetical protein [uncultured Tateyamaria sp.]|uniref:hypothetical protein n=1 Tax=uncultured Tateyamaria sp. TaxID=455651 RepID=UPI002611DF3F|nr:hypothetical protein [uncultured Tateyamaria sp.]